ncbi:MAG: methionine ABC transporter permease [Eggerthellaceae bacterium]|jgi:D-methionine transport system permease protein|nr:methionine ABC transporter permease [Eggerthellaceae bacterium]MEE0344455.1 methionine ABC transporter permease [Eggerthellaceae bacterium]CCY04934.1 binding-protein-dependent transport systems inner membrane component [Eggerthella sp. CAG:1427]
MEYLQLFFAQYGELLLQGTWDTIVMTLVSTVFAYIIGIPLGVAVVLTDPKKGLLPNKAVNAVLGWIINIGRSIPFIILLVAIIPFTRLVVGTSLGVPGAIVPLVVSAAPFVGRMVEQSLAEVDASLVEAAQSFGATVWQIVIKVYLWESLPSLIRGFSITLITLLGYSAMAGTVGAGGLGDIAIRYGYQRYMVDMMIATIIILIVVVQVIQSVCDFAARKVDKKK